MALRVIPLFILLLLSWRKSKRQKSFLLIACICMAIMIAFTIFYIYPVNDILMRQAGGGKSATEIQQMTSDWVCADRLRYLVGCIGYLFLLRSFQLNNRPE